MADSKISALTSGGLVQAADALVVARAGASLKVSPAGIPVLVYRYTVAGSDKASIDTGADTADAGSNDWTSGDLLEIYFQVRTDDAGGRVNGFLLTVNNDTGSNYDMQQMGISNTTVGGTASLGQTSWGSPLDNHGSGGDASYATSCCIIIPNYAGTTFKKVGTFQSGTNDSTVGNDSARMASLGWRSTAAITRFKLAATGTQKLKVGTQLLIYKRLAS